MPTSKPSAVTASEVRSLFSDLKDAPALVLAVSGGPDSTALMILAARWVRSLKRKPTLLAVTVDHGLRAQAKAEAANVARLAGTLGIAHRTLRWTGTKPATGLQQAARAARYRLLAKAAHEAGALHILTAHTLDDQAETVMIRMMRGSGMTGLSAMARIAAVPGSDDLFLIRPLLGIAKARLIATLDAGGVAFADDPSNRDPRFTRARLRGVMPQLAREGLDARRLVLLAHRLRRADRAIDDTADEADATLRLSAPAGATVYEAGGFAALPAEIALRLIGRAVTKAGDEGPVELGKLEALADALDAAQNTGTPFRRSLAGAIVTLVRGREGQNGKITVERAPPRRYPVAGSLTKRRPGKARHPKKR